MKEHKKSKENLIGKIIYGFLLFMPLLAIAVTCAYVIFNKNAYQSYYGEEINEKTYTSENLLSDLETGEKYEYIPATMSNTYSITVAQNRIYVENVEPISASNQDFTQVAQFALYSNNSNQPTIYFYKNDGTFLFNAGNTSFTFNYLRYTQSDNKLGDIISNEDLIYKITYNSNSYLSDVFYYSIEEVEQSPLFSWSNNTATYNVLQGTCQTLGITTTFIPMLLAYWLMTSLMYLLYDIALIMVHMAHRKIHEFEESI